MKRLSYLFLLFLMPAMVFAQDATDQEKGKKEKIKGIKLSEAYVFADAVTADNLSEAQQNSLDLLRTNVNEIFAERLHMPKEDVEKIWDVIEDKCQNVTIKKGDLFRVFTYILKDYLLPGKKKTSAKDNKPAEVSKEEVFIPDEEDVEKLSSDIIDVTTGGDETANVEVAVPRADAEAVPEPEQKMEEVASPVAHEDTIPTTVIATPVTPVEDVVPAESAKEEEAVTAPELEPVVKELLAISTYKELITSLNRKKEDGTLIYGSTKTMRSPEKCYIAVFKNNEVVTILDKGSKERLNLKTNQSDALSNYKGHGAILFQIF